MKRLLFVIALAALVPAAAGPLDRDADPDDWRLMRDMQARAGRHQVLAPQPGNTGELLLAAAALGDFAATAPSGTVGPDDYDALYALLQRYRDELAELGLNYDKLLVRLKLMQQRAEELQTRLDGFHPLDGMKIHGRLISFFDDFHILGNKAINGPVPKPPKKGIRFQLGMARADIGFALTRGLFSGQADFSTVGIWGGGVNFGSRQVNFEIRTPVVFQFGDLHVNTTPLTLWRNEEYEPFLAEPYVGRKERVEEDYLLHPKKVPLTAVRASTDLELFKSFTLQLRNVLAVPGHPFVGNDVDRIYQYPPNNDDLMVNYTVYMNSWTVGIPTPLGFTPSWNGTYFTDAPNSRPNGLYRQMHSLTHSGRLHGEKGIFFGDLEFAMASYMKPWLVADAEALEATGQSPEPLTGTAFTFEAGVKGKFGKFKAFGRVVDASFHSPGAQTATRDERFDTLGPFLTEVSHLQPNAVVGIGLPVPPQSRLNRRLLPPGLFVRPNVPVPAPYYAGDFAHLLPFHFTDALSPYGKATPNRQGFGVEASGNFLSGKIKPLVGYEAFTHATAPLVDAMGNVLVNIMAFSRLRAGAEFGFKLWLPMRLSFGYTFNQTGNNEFSGIYDVDGNEVPWLLSSTLIDAGYQIQLAESLRFLVGHRHLDANGLSLNHAISQAKGVVWDSFAYSIRWDVSETANFQVLYENQYFIAPEVSGEEYQLENIYTRLSVYF